MGDLVKNTFFIFLFLFFPELSYAAFNAKKSSTVHVKSGSTFVVENQIDNYRGKLIKEDGASISGSEIVFNKGTFEDGNGQVKLTGNLDLSSLNKILLNGFKTFKGKRGSVVRELKISGLQNRIEGILQLGSDIVLQDHNTSVTYAAEGRVPTNIVLNGGKILLEEDLYFVDDVSFTGSGVISLNGRKMSFGGREITCNASLYLEDAADVELNANLHLAQTWTFSGQSILQGNGKILYLDEGGEIVTERGSSLLIENVTIRNISGSNIRCLDSASTMSLQNVNWVQDGNYSFTVGALDIFEKVCIKGDYTFAYQSAKKSTINKYSKLILSLGTTFSFDPIWNGSISDWTDAQKFLAFIDKTSEFDLKGATLKVTTTGIQFLKGTMNIEGDSRFISDSIVPSDGIIFGDGISSANDFDVNFDPDAIFRCSSGFVVDKSVE